jgi:hypothetical protein
MPQRVAGAGVVKEAPFIRLKKLSEVSLPPAVPIQVEVQQGERDTMHPHPITAMLPVDAIPIHPAIKYPPGEDHGVGLPWRGAA